MTKMEAERIIRRVFWYLERKILNILWQLSCLKYIKNLNNRLYFFTLMIFNVQHLKSEYDRRWKCI
jgi:hypothetical protein